MPIVPKKIQEWNTEAQVQLCICYIFILTFLHGAQEDCLHSFSLNILSSLKQQQQPGGVIRLNECDWPKISQ